jgi:hypothetical protein
MSMLRFTITATCQITRRLFVMYHQVILAMETPFRPEQSSDTMKLHVWKVYETNKQSSVCSIIRDHPSSHVHAKHILGWQLID